MKDCCGNCNKEDFAPSDLSLIENVDKMLTSRYTDVKESIIERIKELLTAEPGSFKDRVLKTIKIFLHESPLKVRFEGRLKFLIAALEELEARLDK